MRQAISGSRTARASVDPWVACMDVRVNGERTWPGRDRLAKVRRISEGAVESHRRLHQLDHGRVFQRRSFHKLQRCHLVLSAGLQARLDASQALAAPESEQDTPFLCADEENGSIGEIH